MQGLKSISNFMRNRKMLQLATRLRGFVLENKPSPLQKRWARVTQAQRDMMGTDGRGDKMRSKQHRLIIQLRISFIHQWFYSTMLGPGLLFSSVIIFYTVGRTPWTGDQPVARPLPIYRITQTQNKRTHRDPCLEWNSNQRSQYSSGRRQFMP
jgi:hypothetical protein